jgi:hypothetical protein
MKRAVSIPEAAERPRRAVAAIGWLLLCLFLAAFAALHAQAPPQSLEGRVVNGTTGKPVAKAEVNLVFMAQGMTPAATQVTDSEGKFRFDKAPSSGGSPALLRVEYQGATYSRPVLPQQSSGNFEIQVFDAGHDRGSVAVREHAILLHPSGNSLMVLEEIMLDNRSQPAKTYVNPDGTLPFTLAGKPHEEVRVTVQGPGGMPIGQTPVAKSGENRFAIAYPIRPGETQVRLEYSLDYQSPFQFSKTLDLPAEQVVVVTPGSQVQVKGDGLTAIEADPQTGFTGYRVVPKGNKISLEISGEAPENARGQGGEGGASEEGPATLVPIPDPVSERRWLIVAAVGLILVAGLVYHYRHD